MKDFVIMRQGPGFMALASPPVIKEVTGMVVTNEEIGGAMMHAAISGTCDHVVQSDEEGLAFCRNLVGYFPSNWRKTVPRKDYQDPLSQQLEELLDIVPFDLAENYDMHRIIALLADGGDYTEMKSLYAPSLITCFARIGGYSVGIVANNPLVGGGFIDSATAIKEARFVRFCDCFNIPLIFLADTVGARPTYEQQLGAFDKQAAKVMYAICEATVPKITVQIRNCGPFGDLFMSTEQMGGDLVVAWPPAKIGQVQPKKGYEMYLRQIDGSGSQLSEEEIAAFLNKYNTIFHSGSRSLFQDIIDPRKTRDVIINGLTWFKGKNEDRPWKKHGNIPL
jgi:propionyl-CoA carboxylase beta chain